MVTAEELQAVVNAFEIAMAGCMIACAKSWLPHNPAHIQDAAKCLEILATCVEDEIASDLMAGTVSILRETQPNH